ncbi:fungal-specific transcription factor domain-containing protein [Limtongia smithiae]|uniref:fungal-specific transcription factor domain-containing protein n=1 Tax=Limtongia smithiae TaxID=1125753 RepID=UPI0034CDF4D0
MPRSRDARGGCWICLLRRKKCDGPPPFCNSCSTLGITCDYREEKPEWMDGGLRQSEIARRIQTQIKEGAELRRETKGTRRQNGEMTFVVNLKGDIAPEDESSLQNDSSTTLSSQSGSASGRTKSLLDRNHAGAKSILDIAAQKLAANNNFEPLVALGRAWEMDFIMIYIDFVFPFLFPFYHPSIVSTSRSWLLTFLMQSDAVFHSVISLSAYFFTAGLGDVFPEQHENCKDIVWDQVIKQADLSFANIQQEIAALNEQHNGTAVVEKARLMEGIIQLLIFQSFLGRSASWSLHLTPAISLFEELIRDSFTPEKQKLHSVLDEMKWPAGEERDFDRLIWNPDQAGFRFFAAVLVYIDIIASTSLRRPPQLAYLHANILGELRLQDVDVQIDLSAFVGCQNWPLIAVSEISSLDLWKKEMQAAGLLDPQDLTARAYGIAHVLKTGLSHLEESVAKSMRPSRFKSPHYVFNQLDTRKTIWATQIWAHAARIYLSLVVSGFDPANLEIQESVDHVLMLLAEVDSIAEIRALAWPICIIGCLISTNEREQVLLDLFDDVGRQGALSTLREVQEIISAVWTVRRSHGLSDSWDIADCLNILGEPVLLV